MGKIYDEMKKNRGGICRYLTDDHMFHMTECLLKRAAVSVLFDRFEELGLKHSVFAYELCSDACVEKGCDKFEKRSDKDNNGIIFPDYDDMDFDIPYTKNEVEAMELAKKEFSDDEKVRKLYLELKYKTIERKESELKKQLDELDDLRKEKEDFEK